MTTATATTTADPKALDELAARLLAEAKDVRNERGELERSLRTLTWEGKGGDRFRDRARTRLHDLDAVADDLEAAARQLKGSAEQAGRERAELARTRDRVLALRTALGTKAFNDLLKDKGIATPLPAASDPAWKSIGKALLR